MYLLKEKGGSKIYYLNIGTECTVGRKNADVIINDDASISRKHATITTEKNSAILIDCGSKYGTFLNGKKITPNSKVSMAENDEVKFGVFQSVYVIKKNTLVTCGSGLTDVQKTELRKNIEALGGTLLNNWTSTCTHLTVQEIVLTMKVLLALIDDRPIVNLEYWKKYVLNIQAKLPPPDIAMFKPPFGESLVDSSSVVVKPERKVLFKGKIFVFPSAKIKAKMVELIERTGGTAISWDKQPISPSQITDTKHDYLFVFTDEIKQIPQSLREMYLHIQKLGQRTIPIQEIAMAVLTCSCEKDCNPNFNRIEKVFIKEETVSNSEVFALVSDTQSQDVSLKPKEELVIPASLDEDVEIVSPPTPAVNNAISKPSPITVNAVAWTSGTNDLKRISQEPKGNPFKRMKLDITSKTTQFSQSINESVNESRKRKADVSLGFSSKKSSLRENPFAALRVHKETASTDNNPFHKAVENNSQRQNQEITIEESEIKTSISDNENSQNLANETSTSDTSKITWLSKDNCKAEKTEIEEEFKEVYKLFKDTVVIETFPVVLRQADTSIQVSQDSSTCKKNFKKFKKVRPLKPQVTIVSVITPMTSNAHQITVLSDEDEDEEFPRRAAPRLQTRRFNF